MDDVTDIVAGNHAKQTYLCRRHEGGDHAIKHGSHSTLWGHGEALVGALSNEREMSKVRIF